MRFPLSRSNDLTIPLPLQQRSATAETAATVAELRVFPPFLPSQRTPSCMNIPERGAVFASAHFLPTEGSWVKLPLKEMKPIALCTPLPCPRAVGSLFPRDKNHPTSHMATLPPRIHLTYYGHIRTKDPPTPLAPAPSRTYSSPPKIKVDACLRLLSKTEGHPSSLEKECHIPLKQTV